MVYPRLSLGARLYLWAVIASGVVAGVRLLVVGDPVNWDWKPVAFFGLLAVLATALSVTYQGFLPSRHVHQIGTSFAYALFFIGDAGAVVLVLCVMTAADWLVNRRRVVTGLFNAAQLCVALLAANWVRDQILPGFDKLDHVDAATMVKAVGSLVAFFVVNHLLTHIIVSLANRRSLLSLPKGTRGGLLNETLCIVSGLGMAVLWWVNPPLALLGVIPIWILKLLLIQLSRHEQELESRQMEIRSLQELGLEIGAELDAEKLRRAVVKIAPEALQASGALLAVFDREREGLVVLAHEGIRPSPPELLPPGGLTGEFFERGAVLAIPDLRAEPEAYPELAFIDARGALCAPLTILERREGLLVLVHGDARRPFDKSDVERLETLVRFVDVALSNAQLVSDIKQMQEQLLQTEKMSALGMLVSGVAHEINNPLTTITGYTQLVLAGHPDPDARQMLEKVVKEAGRAGRIVQNLLTFSRKHRPEKRLTNLNDILEQVLELRAFDLRAHAIEVETRFQPDLPLAVADPHQLQQVFHNLFSNAEQALIDSDGPACIVVETRAVGERIRASITDNGPGIPPEHVKTLFVPFFTTKEVGQGTGLGLSICYGIIQEHGGRIEVSSRPGQGATFTIDIPAAERNVDMPALVEGVRPEVSEAVGRRVLVVDDEESIGELARDVLEQKGWTVAQAREGSRALEILDTEDFDVLLVDMRMPGMDGRAFYEQLEVRRPDLLRKVLFVTGDVANDATTNFLRSAGAPVLGKPYNVGDLVDAVGRIASTSSGVH